ncbi:MAG: glycerol-3-phosphate dehydrogenase subunit GlpB [Acidimicrobiales bacterium]
MRADVVVVGAGMAGLVAAVRLAEAGRRVVVVAKGAGSTRLAPGTIDILGYAPDLVEHPAPALASFVATHPEHPYARVGGEAVAAAVEWLRERVTVCHYVGSLDDNMLLPTAIGAAKPSAVVPETMAGGDLRNGGRLLLCGLSGFKDFFPALAADTLAASAVAKVVARPIELSPPTGGEADVGSLAFARRFEDEGFRRAVVHEVLAALEGEDAVGFPAVLGRSDVGRVWSDLQHAIGRPVFEIPTLPPSVPGIRLLTSLQTRLREEGGRLIMGSDVIGARQAASRVEAVRVRSAARDLEFEAGSFVLASGGFLTGGLHVDSDGRVEEVVFGLPVTGVPEAGEYFSLEYLADHPLAPAGVAVDRVLRPVDPAGDVAYENLYAAGAVLAGAEPWRELSGEGIALATGYTVAGHILERQQ